MWYEFAKGLSNLREDSHSSQVGFLSHAGEMNLGKDCLVFIGSGALGLTLAADAKRSQFNTVFLTGRSQKFSRVVFKNFSHFNETSFQVNHLQNSFFTKLSVDYDYVKVFLCLPPFDDTEYFERISHAIGNLESAEIWFLQNGLVSEEAKSLFKKHKLIRGLVRIGVSKTEFPDHSLIHLGGGNEIQFGTFDQSTTHSAGWQSDWIKWVPCQTIMKEELIKLFLNFALFAFNDGKETNFQIASNEEKIGKIIECADQFASSVGLKKEISVSIDELISSFKVVAFQTGSNVNSISLATANKDYFPLRAILKHMSDSTQSDDFYSKYIDPIKVKFQFY